MQLTNRNAGFSATQTGTSSDPQTVLLIFIQTGTSSDPQTVLLIFILSRLTTLTGLTSTTFHVLLTRVTDPIGHH